MDGSSVLSPSYLRRPESYDRLGAPPGSTSQRSLANRLLAARTAAAAGKKMPKMLRKESFRWLVPRMSERRLVCKNGECNISRVNIDKRGRRFLADIFTTMVDIQWRLNLLIFTMAFTVSWIIFALAWWLVAFSHQDLENYEHPGWKPCVEHVYDFPTALLFSIETQQTIGYGYRCMNPDCPHAIALVMFQSCFGIITQALMTGLVFAKLSRPKKRAQTLMFSKRALICPRDGQLYLLFRVGDMRKSHIVEAQVRALIVSKRVTREGEVLPVYERELVLGDSQEEGDHEGRLFLVWPVIVQHCITESSPLWDVSADDLSSGHKHFEIIIILEGIVESTGMTAQARSSYLPSEILWGHRFERLVRYRRDDGMYQVDYARFHQTVPISDGVVSRNSAQQQAAARNNNDDNDDDTSTTDDDYRHDETVEKSVSEHQRRPKRRRRKPGVQGERGSPNPAGEAAARDPRGAGDDNGTTSTRSESPSTAAGAAQMLQLAVGRSPVRARRLVSCARTPGRLTDASLAAFDLSPDLDDTATTTTVPAGDMLDTADFSLPSFDLQT